MRLLAYFLMAVFCASASPLQAARSSSVEISVKSGQELVRRALTNELNAARDTSLPMRFRLRKINPHRTIVKDIIETRDGSVARLVSVNDLPLSQEIALKEQNRLDVLLTDPSRQHHRQQSEAADLERAITVLRALPQALIYQFTGIQNGIARFVFHSNPKFHSQSLETLALTKMTGELWVNISEGRVTHLEGHLDEDVDFGWGILGRLNKGGWIAIEQAEVAPHIWRNTYFKMVMSGRVVYKMKVFDTIEELSQFTPVDLNMGYEQAVHLLEAEPTEPIF